MKERRITLNPAQHGEYIGFKASLIDDSGTFEQSEIFWSQNTVGGDPTGSNKTEFEVIFDSDFMSGSTINPIITASDVNRVSNTPSHMWQIGPTGAFISGNPAVGQENLLLLDEYFNTKIGIQVSVIDDLGNFTTEMIWSEAL